MNPTPKPSETERQSAVPCSAWLGALSCVTYLIYCIVWDCGIIAATGYLVFWKGHSGWWFLVAMIIAGTSYQPATWRKLWMPEAPNAGGMARELAAQDSDSSTRDNG